MLGHLALVRPAHYLADALNDMAKAAGAAHRLPARKLPAVGIDREIALVSGVHRVEKGTYLTFLAEPGVFEAHGLKDGVSIVEFGELDVFGPVPGHFEGFAGGDDHRRCGDPLRLPDRVVVADPRRCP